MARFGSGSDIQYASGTGSVYIDNVLEVEEEIKVGDTVTISTDTVTATNLVGNASTAAALQSNPDDCSANQFATTIAANGNLTCSALVDDDVPDTITASNYLLLAGGTLTGLIESNSGLWTSDTISASSTITSYGNLTVKD